ncbi:MAG: bifunctional pyr operon transcriptional regulator/uracil phosphoribosyltransferase PyrR [Polyangiaceae bacterium]|nr:bifunctional pyr operon transcriptional regulator/uracil phosphoribosyltransferase PyrR [Polyangiaceae bacterium]
MAAEIVERGRRLGGGTTAPALVLVGIRRGGDPLAKRIAEKIAGLASGGLPAIGAVDITLYRDDAATALPNPKIGPSKIPVALEGKRVVLVDDVLNTGRTIRAALDAVLDFGRPKIIELACLVDRGGRELPIQPDYVGLTTQVGVGERVELVWKRTGPGVDDEEPWAVRVPSPRPSSPRREST